MSIFWDYHLMTALIVLTASAVAAWALVLSHYSRKWVFKVITMNVVLPVIGLSAGLQIYKSNLDAKQNAADQARLSDLSQKAETLEQRMSELNATSLQIARSQMSESARTRQLSDSITDMEENVGAVSKYFQKSTQDMQQLSDSIAQLSDETSQLADADNQNSERTNQSLEETKASVRKVQSDNAAFSEQLQIHLRSMSNSPIFVMQPSVNRGPSYETSEYGYTGSTSAFQLWGIKRGFPFGSHFP